MKRFAGIFQVLILMTLVGGAAFVVGPQTWNSELAQIFSSKSATKEKCNLPERSKEFNREPYYTGTLIDAHLHMPTSSGIVSAVSSKLGLSTPAWSKTLSTDYLNCLLESEGIKQAFGFYLLTKYSSGGEVNIAKKIEKKYPGRIAHFLMPSLISPFINVGTKTITDALAKNPKLFKGIGEVKSMDGRSLDNPFLMELYEVAEKNKLVVMMHPFQNDKEVVEKIVKKHPGVKFLLHGGGDNQNFALELIKKYKNVYYSVDANITSLYGWEREQHKNPPGKDLWLPYFKKNFDQILAERVEEWKWRIESYPDRYLWGTDRWSGWQFDAEVGGLIEQFGRAFIGKLDPSVREKFAYKNAQELLK